MAKYSTSKNRRRKKKLTTEQLQIIEQGITATVEYVNRWKERELFAMALNPTKELPVCVPISKNAYLIGKFGVRKTRQGWVAKDSGNENEFHFCKRANAVVFTLCEQTGHRKIAREIQKHDADITKLTDDLNVYNTRKLSALNKKDYWRYDYFTIKAQSVEFKLEEAKNQLEKSMKLAKYFKIW